MPTDSALVETPHFRVLGACVEPRQPLLVDNDLADAIVDELGPLGLIPDVSAFEDLFVRTVESSAPTAGLAWNSFYRNTLGRLRKPAAAVGDDGSVATFGRIYAAAARLVSGSSTLDVGCCFGFFPILLAEQRPDLRVIASDLSVGTVALAGQVAASLGSAASFLPADAAALPFRDRAVDTVTVLHLLEHLPITTGAAVVNEALRVADRRVVVAVPLEETPNSAYGHLRAFSVGSLAALGQSTGWRSSAWLRDGGWLCLDRPGS